MRLWLKKGPFVHSVPQLWALSFARSQNWALHSGPLRPLGRKSLLWGRGRPGSASCRRMGTFQTVKWTLQPSLLDFEEMPEAVSPHFILKLLLKVSSCFCRRQIASFLLASVNALWKPRNRQDFLFAEGTGSQSQAWSPARSAGARWGFSDLSLGGSEL